MLLIEKKSGKYDTRRCKPREKVGGTLYVRMVDESGVPRETDPIGWTFICIYRYIDVAVCTL